MDGITKGDISTSIISIKDNLQHLIPSNVNLTIAEKTGLSRATVIRSIEKLITRKNIEKRTSVNNLGTIYKVNLPEGAEIQPNEIHSRGESTIASNYAYNLAQLGFEVLAIDLDPQGHLPRSLQKELRLREAH